MFSLFCLDGDVFLAPGSIKMLYSEQSETYTLINIYKDVKRKKLNNTFPGILKVIVNKCWV